MIYVPRPLEVLQREYGIAIAGGDYDQIGTTLVWTCTVWCGFDKASGLGFLCHFDLPTTAKAVPEIVSHLSRLIGQDHQLETKLLGGSPLIYPYSALTRRWIREHLATSLLPDISVEDGPYVPCWSKGRGYSISLRDGAIGDYSLKPVVRSPSEDVKAASIWSILTQPMQVAPGTVFSAEMRPKKAASTPCDR